MIGCNVLIFLEWGIIFIVFLIWFECMGILRGLEKVD